MIAPVTDTDSQTLLYLPEVFIELATEVGQRTVIGGFQHELQRFN